MDRSPNHRNYQASAEIAAVFDLDGTLYTGHIIRGIARHHRTHKVKRVELSMFMITTLAIYPLWGLKLLSEAKAREITAARFGWTVRGWTPDEATVAFAWIARQYVQPLVRPDVVQRLRLHQADGHRVILVSGTPAPLLGAIGRQLGIEETVGTPLVLQAGRYTGASEPPICQGLGKVRRLETQVAGGGSVDWPRSYAYADSYTDLPLLEHVGHPVAVYPDDQLAARARKLGWEIIE